VWKYAGDEKPCAVIVVPIGVVAIQQLSVRLVAHHAPAQARDDQRVDDPS
jgi:hypothetical protein